MSSTFITEGDSDTSSANDTVIIIVNNESGSISMDEETLQKLLVSGTENVSVVQLAEDNHPVNNEDVHDPSQPQVNLTLEGFYTPGMDHQTPVENLEPQPSSVDTIDPFLNIDQEEIEKIAHALQSDQASQILAGSLSEMLDTDSQSEVLGLLDAHCVPVHDPHAELVTAINLEHSYSLVPPERAHLMYSMMPKTRLSDYSDIDEGRTPSPALNHHNTVVENASQRPPSPKRRSQRQIERSEKEQLEKIRAENEEMLKKEKEVMKKKLQDDWQLDQFAETPDMKDDTLPSPDELSDSLASHSPVLEDLKRPPPTRMAEIRQAMQEQILAIDPLGKKVLPTTPKVSPSPVKTQPERQNRQEKSVLSTSPVATPTIPSVATPTTPSVATPNDVSGRKSYPKRENRKPPPHLRDVLFGPSLFSAPDVMKVVGGGPTSPEKKPKADNAKKAVANPEVMAALAETAAIFEGTTGGEGGKKGAKVGKAKAELMEKPKIEEEEQEDDDEESGSEQSWNSEDDPDRLWCICRKPHNNRFMICCDKCEDWFHGKCVGLTRQMGKAMEEKGIEWVCPKCKAQATAKVNERKNSHVSLPDPDPESAPEEESMTMKCIISGCSKEARPNSIYCSDQCIMQHAKESLALYSKDKEQTVVKEEKKEAQAAATAVAPADTKKPAPEPLKAQTFYSKGATTPTTPSAVGTATTKTSPQGNNLQVTRKIIVLQELPSGKSKGAAGAALEDMAVMVYERKSGKILQGNLAPKLSNLETWLKQHPTFEVLKPGMIPKAKEKVEKPVAPTPQRKRKEPPKPAVPEKKEKKPSGPEVMRTSVKTSLKDALFGRAKDAADITMNEADITELADKIEEELYAYFGDVNLKYKSKYRSLTFNIRDTKNEGLFRKILKGEMKPKQLVRMSPEDLASQELAQWRERENKHQLEIIQKTELESLSMANKYILKTHKGEEVIEADDALKTLDSAQKDVTGIPGLEDTTSQHKSHVFDLNCQICSGKIKESDYFPKPDGKEKDSKESKEKDRHSKSKDSKDRHRHHHHHRRRSSSSSSHSHSAKKEHRDKDRDKEKERKSSSSSSKDSKDKSKDKDRSHSRHKDRHKDKERERKDSSGSSKEKRSEKSKTTPSGSDKSKSAVSEQAPPPFEAPKEEKHALEQNTEPLTQIKAVEQKPTSVSVKKEPQEDDKVENIEVVSEKTEIKEEKPESKPVVAPEVTKEQETKAVTAIQEEPTSTVIISTPEQRSPVVGSPRVGLASAVWKGNIVSSESGKFHVLGYEVSGIVDKLPAELPDSLDVVGRIKPVMAWDYIKQTKRVGTREIVILKFLPTTDMDKKNFSAFNYYLTKCDRLGVIGNLPKTIKDFYIFPLAPSDPIPPALLPFEGSGLDSERPVMLLGVVIRAKRMKRSLERPSARFKSKEERVEAIRAAKMAKITDEPYDPSSPTINLSPMYKPSKRKPETVELPSSKAPKRDDDDEPYSPGQPLDEESAETITDTIPAVKEGPETKDVGSSKALSDQVSILEELTRKIEENKRQIRSMSSALLPTDNTAVFTGLAASTAPSTSLITQTISTIPGLGDAPSVPIPGLGDNTEEPYSPSNQRYTPSPPPPTPPVTSVAAVVTSALPALASKIAIPSNLQEILSTIQKKEQEQKRTILKSDPIVMNYAGTRPELSDPVCEVETLAAKDVDMRVLPPTPNMAQGPIMATVPHLGSPAQLQGPATILTIRTDIPPHLASQMPPATNLPPGATIPLGGSVSMPLGGAGAPTDPRMRPAPPQVASSSVPLDNKGLRALSDAELLAKALEMEQELTGASPAPNQKKKKGKGGKDKQKQQQQPRRDRYNSRSSSDYSPPRRGRDRDWDRDYDKERGRARNNRWESDREINNRDNGRNAGWRQNTGPSPQYNAPMLNVNTVPRQQQPMVPVMTSPRAQMQQHMNVPPMALGQPPPVVQAPPVAPPILHTEAPRPVVLTNPSNSACNVTPAPQGAVSQSVPKETAPMVPPMGRFVPAKSVASNEEEEEEEPPPPGE